MWVYLILLFILSIIGYFVIHRILEPPPKRKQIVSITHEPTRLFKPNSPIHSFDTLKYGRPIYNGNDSLESPKNQKFDSSPISPSYPSNGTSPTSTPYKEYQTSKIPAFSPIQSSPQTSNQNILIETDQNRFSDSRRSKSDENHISHIESSHFLPELTSKSHKKHFGVPKKPKQKSLIDTSETLILSSPSTSDDSNYGLSIFKKHSKSSVDEEKPVVVEPVKTVDFQPKSVDLHGIEMILGFNNPMTLRASKGLEKIDVSVEWPKEDREWKPQWFRRIEKLSSDFARSEYFHEDKLYIDRPDWGYRIILWVPPSPGWKPSWNLSEPTGISHGIASSLPTRTKTDLVKPKQTDTITGISSKPIEQKTNLVEAPSTSNMQQQIQQPVSSFKPIIQTPTFNKPPQDTSVSFKKPNEQPIIQQKTSNEPLSSTNASQSISTTITENKPLPTSIPSNISQNAPKPNGAPFSSSFPKFTASTQPTSTSTSFSSTPTFPPKVSSPLSTQQEIRTDKESISPQVSSNNFISAPISKLPAISAVSSSSTVSTTSLLSKPSSSPTPSSVATPSTLSHSKLSPQHLSPIDAFLPPPLKQLPSLISEDSNLKNRVDLLLPGPGTSKQAYQDYVRIIDQYKVFQKDMNAQHPKVKLLRDIINDVSNKVGATARSFHEKLGNDLHQALELLKAQASDRGAYLWALDQFALVLFREAVGNKHIQKDGNSVKYGERAVFLVQRHLELEIFLKYHIFTKCPYAIPIYPQRRPGQSEVDYLIKELGFKPANGASPSDPPLEQVESIDLYASRMRRVMYLYAAIMNTVPPNTPNPMGIASAWTFIVRFISLPRSELSLYFLEPVVTMCSRKLLFAYGNQWTKLAQIIKKFISEPPKAAGTLSFFDSAPLISIIASNLEKPTAYAPIQHNPDREALMERLSTQPDPTDPKEGLTQQGVMIIHRVIEDIDRYIQTHPQDDVNDDLLATRLRWEKLLMDGERSR